MIQREICSINIRAGIQKCPFFKLVNEKKKKKGCAIAQINERVLCGHSKQLRLISTLPLKRRQNSPLHRPNHIRDPINNIPQPKTPPPNPRRIDKEVHQRPVNNTKREEDTHTLPLIILLHIQRAQVLPPIRKRAVRAIRRRVRVAQVPRFREVGYEGRCVLPARLVRRRVEVAQFCWGADDGQRAHGGGEGAADPPGDGAGVVHPVAPEDGGGGVGAEDAVEEVDHDEEEGEDVGDDGEGGREGGDPLAPAHLEEVEEQGHEVHVAGGAGVGGEADGVVPEQPVDDGGADGGGDLGDDVGGAEGDPAVDAARELARFPEAAVYVELGDDAVHHDGGEEDDEEDGEHAVLHVGNRVTELPECL